MVKVGQKILMADYDGIYTVNKRPVLNEFVIKEIYKNHVLCTDKHNIRRCFCLGDLIKNGVIAQKCKEK